MSERITVEAVKAAMGGIGWGAKGLTDKLYWRFVGSVAHCFKKTLYVTGEIRGYSSLCGQHDRLFSGGQACNRPSAMLRCAACDAAEMKRRGVEKSMPESKGWERY